MDGHESSQGCLCANNPAAPDSNPTHNINAFSIVIEFCCDEDKNKRKRGRDWPIFKKQFSPIPATATP